MNNLQTMGLKTPQNGQLWQFAIITTVIKTAHAVLLKWDFRAMTAQNKRILTKKCHMHSFSINFSNACLQILLLTFPLEIKGTKKQTPYFIVSVNIHNHSIHSSGYSITSAISPESIYNILSSFLGVKVIHNHWLVYTQIRISRLEEKLKLLETSSTLLLCSTIHA